MIFLLLGCAPAKALHGTLVDARTGAPIAGATVRGEAEGERCLRVSSVSDAAGAFVIATPCAGTYTLTPVDPSWWLPEAVTTRGAESKLEAWRAPESGGIWRLRGEELQPLPTNTSVGTLTTSAGATAPYPLVLPGEPPALVPGDLLVLSGGDLTSWTVSPVIPSPIVPMPTAAGPAKFPAWCTIGVTLAADGAGVPATVSVNETRAPGGVAVPEVGQGLAPLPQDAGRPDQVRYLDVGKLPPGSYALSAPASARALLFTVGG